MIMFLGAAHIVLLLWMVWRLDWYSRELRALNAYNQTLRVSSRNAVDQRLAAEKERDETERRLDQASRLCASLKKGRDLYRSLTVSLLTDGPDKEALIKLALAEQSLLNQAIEEVLEPCAYRATEAEEA